MITKYGYIPTHQLHSTKKYFRKSIFYLLLYADPNEKIKYPYVDVNKAFDNVQYQLMGFNKILLESPAVLEVLCILEAAKIIYNESDFDFAKYRKLILDAGTKIMEVKEGDDYDHP